MAHGDYNCCAICDDKMDYVGWGAETKEEICECCLKNIEELNLNIKNIDDLKEYIKSEDYKKLEQNFIKLGFHFCYYENEIDDLAFKRFQPSGMDLEEYLKRIDRYNYDIVKKVEDKGE